MNEIGFRSLVPGEMVRLGENQPLLLKKLQKCNLAN